METNFDYLLKKEEYADFAKQAVEAEKSLSISPATCAILSRRALELAVRFVLSAVSFPNPFTAVERTSGRY